MNGLLSQTPQQGGPPSQAPRQQGGPPQAEPQETPFGPESFGGKYVGPTSPDKSTWTPDEIEGFDAYKTVAREALHGNTAKSAEGMLENAPNKPDGVAELGASIFLRADEESAELLGGEPPAPLVRLWAANEVVPQVYELAEAVGVTFDAEEQEMVTATMLNKYFAALERKGELDMTTGMEEFTQVTGVDARKALMSMPTDVKRASATLRNGRGGLNSPQPPFQKKPTAVM